MASDRTYENVLAHKEIRLFFDAKNERALLRFLVKAQANVRPTVFDKPFTETVYFTAGKTDQYDARLNMPRLRMRRYGATNPKTLSLKTRGFYGELKFFANDHEVLKIRKKVSPLKLVRELGSNNSEVRKSIFGHDMPRLFPTGATRTRRRHFQLSDNGRMTVDTHIQLFGFRPTDWKTADEICELKEGKIEFKLKEIPEFTSLVKDIGLEDAWKIGMIYQRERDYLEQQSRLIFLRWIKASI